MDESVKILYVDDEQGNLDYFKSVFRREYTIYTAQSGHEGLKVLADEPDISIIFTDQRMPRMTGVEFLQEVMKLPIDPVKILVTGYADMDTVITAINEGHIYHYISKPWTYDEMRIIISRAIENQRLVQLNKELLVRSERKEKEMVISELESLRNQVNPHFLFNCLNTLHALVSDNQQAREFIRGLSNIYRYLLEHHKDNIVRLSEELKFCNNYFHLQNVRFQGAIEYISKVDPAYADYVIPSASLQLLIENTVKHNVVTVDRPLMVHVYNEGDWLVVKNNFQFKSATDSTGIGQENLIRRYSYITDKQPLFYEQDGFYYSKIPLLEETF
ncbi:histidine kinase [Marinoscillum sp. MHG1-6]|uniref:histidine kinase n=1 Tax=Marinoscillum sp. MHG1-6 TaxID=2959627 RepID=UPI002157F9AD|nr:histidine kinase [Marinoscillum sp. MHG1-6]